LKLKSSILEIWQNLKSFGFCQILTVDDDQLQKAQGTDHFDQNFGGFLGLRSRMLNSTRETARNWAGRVGFWASFAAFR
jgi:hypothetical protein